MKSKWVSVLLRYGVTAVIGVVISAMTAWHQGFAWSQSFALNARYVSDGCFVAAVLLVGVGALSWISCTGFLTSFIRHKKYFGALYSAAQTAGSYQLLRL